MATKKEVKNEEKEEVNIEDKEVIGDSIPKSAKAMFKKASLNTRIVETAVGPFKVLIDLPYTVARQITAEFFNALYTNKKEMSAKVIEELLDQIVLHVVLEPKIKKEDLEMDGAPIELLGLAMTHFAEILQGLKYLIGDRGLKEEVEDEDEPE